MPDPLSDLERRVNRLERDLNTASNQTERDKAILEIRLKGEFEAIRKDISELKEDDKEFVTLDRYLVMERLFWAAVTALIVGLIGGALAILTRGPG